MCDVKVFDILSTLNFTAHTPLASSGAETPLRGIFTVHDYNEGDTYARININFSA